MRNDEFLSTPFGEPTAPAIEISSPQDLIAEAKAGRMVILVDDEDRENEGDLVIPAGAVTPEHIAFMAAFGRGLVCVSIDEEQRERMGLPMMVTKNRDKLATAFTVSVDAAIGTANPISAMGRRETIRALTDPTGTPTDLNTPGHIFPLVARKGGILRRRGHTEASVDLARLAGFDPAGVICEIMRDDGEMARLPDLICYAQKHGLKIGTIEDLVRYRVETEILSRNAVGCQVLQFPAARVIEADPDHLLRQVAGA
jgi:3,4-dihydroxy 2-butanone 4-phosphate synthase/GTP cyclohydrolase II